MMSNPDHQKNLVQVCRNSDYPVSRVGDCPNFRCRVTNRSIGPAAPKLNNRAAKQKEPLLEARQESEESDSLEVIACPNLPPKKLLQPFADEDADVYIVLIPKNPKYTFRMHSHILKRASPWFAKQFQEVSVVEMNKGTAAMITRDTGIKYRFELRLDDHLGYHALKRVVSNFSRYLKLTYLHVELEHTKLISVGPHNVQGAASSCLQQSYFHKWLQPLFLLWQRFI